jgi:hypothetical protein
LRDPGPLSQRVGLVGTYGASHANTVIPFSRSKGYKGKSRIHDRGATGLSGTITCSSRNHLSCPQPTAEQKCHLSTTPAGKTHFVGPSQPAHTSFDLFRNFEIAWMRSVSIKGSSQPDLLFFGPHIYCQVLVCSFCGPRRLGHSAQVQTLWSDVP